MQNPNQTNRKTQQPETAKKGDQANDPNRNMPNEQDRGNQPGKEQAWKNPSPEDMTGIQPGQGRSGKGQQTQRQGQMGGSQNNMNESQDQMDENQSTTPGRQQKQDQPNKQRPDQSDENESEMGSGKRQDDN